MSQGLARRILDGFISTVTGIGSSRDKKSAIRHQRNRRLKDRELEDLYSDQGLARRIVNLFPDDALRKWISINHEFDAEIQARLKALAARVKLREAARKERLHGGAVVFIDIMDGRDMGQPVDTAYGGLQVLGLRVIEKEHLYPCDELGNYGTLPDASTSEYFKIQSSTEGLYIVHRDRLLVFPGIEVSDYYRNANSGWGESALRECLEPLMAYGLTHGTVPTIIQDFIIGILKLDGLNEIIDSDDDGTLKARLDAAITGESYVNKVVIDANDSYSREVANVAGLDTLIRHPERWLCAVSGIPHTKLLSESAGGSLGETGSSEKRDWEEAIDQYQQDKLLGQIEKLVGYIALELKLDDVPQVEFNPQRVMTEKEKAEIHHIQADADVKYYNIGALLVDEIRYSRFSSEYTTSTTLDEAAYASELRGDRIGDAEAAASG